MLKFEQKLLIFPASPVATALQQSVSMLITSNLDVEIIQDAETVKVRAKDLSCDPSWYNQFDILWVPCHSSTVTSGKIFQLHFD